MIDFIFSSEFFKRLFTSVILLFCVGGAYLHSIELFSMMLAAIFVIITLFELPKLVELPVLPFAVVSLIYPGLSIGSLIYLNYKFHSFNLLIPLYPFLVAWTADTFGYIVGKSFGVHKLCPTVSPGKSLEGLLGSIFGVFILNIFIAPRIEIFWLSNLNVLGLILVSVVFTLCAFAGGFLLSFLKRRKGLKDAGDALPGHGGFLDRFDSVFACSLLFLILLTVL
jgi:phosphatidate cytidylyltransferase